MRMETNKLCDRCLTIPFDPRHPPFKVELFPNEYELGALFELPDRMHCPLCRLLRNATDSNQNPLPPSTPLTLKWYKDTRTFRLHGVVHTSICLVGDQSTAPSSNGIFFPVSRLEVDLARVRGWMRWCFQNHPQCRVKVSSGGPAEKHRQSNSYQLPSLRVIDVVDSCIIDKAPSSYLALSYVWGGVPNFRLTTSNRTALAQPGRLQEFWRLLPKTIQDAIKVVRSLGERYLWVDSLCLIQNDPEDLQIGIAVMDLIYERATMTIIAASGPHADYGLPGVMGTPRSITKHIEEIRPGIKLACYPTLDQLLLRTAYNRRAWTFQEQILARRALYFINDTVYFRCQESTFSEHIIDPWSNLSTIYENNAQMSRLSQSLRLQELPWDWDVLLSHYTRRNHTNEQDALSATAGIGRRVSMRMNCTFFQGIPGSMVDLFVTFFGSGPILRRRKKFPSYSWAGWKGQIQQNMPNGALDKWFSACSWIEWHLREPDGTVNRIWGYADFLSAVAKTERKEAILRRKTVFNHEPIGLRTRPTKVKLKPPLPSYPILQFWTFSAYFKIDQINVFSATAAVIGHSGKKCGTIQMEGFEDDKFFEAGGIYEFIFLSQPNGLLLSKTHFDGFSLVRGFSSYQVLVVERGSQISERRGFGYVNIEGTDCFPPGFRWKEFFLG